MGDYNFPEDDPIEIPDWYKKQKKQRRESLEPKKGLRGWGWYRDSDWLDGQKSKRNVARFFRGKLRPESRTQLIGMFFIGGVFSILLLLPLGALAGIRDFNAAADIFGLIFGLFGLGLLINAFLTVDDIKYYSKHGRDD